MFKGTKLYRILKMKCPRCQEGDFFESPPYTLSKMGQVKKQCEKCNQKYEIETGFYQGSYYVSYALGVALFITVVVFNFLFTEKVSPIFLMSSFVLSLLILVPVLYPLSKIIWANLFITYDKDLFLNNLTNLQNGSGIKK